MQAHDDTSKLVNYGGAYDHNDGTEDDDVRPFSYYDVGHPINAGDEPAAAPDHNPGVDQHHAARADVDGRDRYCDLRDIVAALLCEWDACDGVGVGADISRLRRFLANDGI